MTNTNSQQTQRFKVGDFVYVKKERKKGKIIAITRTPYPDTSYKVEIIVSSDKEQQTRTTKLIDVKCTDVLPPAKLISKNDPLQIKVKYFETDIVEPIDKLAKISVGDWIDLRAAETVELKKGEFKIIKLGVGMKLPEGYEANIVPRSSTYKNFKILQTNSYGVIDNSYSGNDDQWGFPALAMEDTVINKNDRICQFRINRIMPKTELIEVKFLDETSRGGFGSTGVK